MMKTVVFLFFNAILLYSCNRPPKDVRIVLKAAGDNRSELQKVINYYKAPGDKEKLRAAYFLIGNMDNKYTIACDEIIKYDPIFAIFDSLEKINKRPTYDSPFMQNKWDSLVEKYGPPSFNNARILPDYKVIKADYLIKNIDLSFKIRQESKWGKKISFENFCEFVLAYRFSHEPLELWRSYFYEQYKSKIDSINSNSSFQLAEAMNKIIPWVQVYKIMASYPYSIPFSKLVKYLSGACPNIVIYVAATMRASGLPVGIDYTTNWGNSSGGHRWNVLLPEDGKAYHFQRYQDTLEIKFVDKLAKIFRETYGKQNIEFTDAGNDVPESLLDDHRIDVTSEYIKTYNIAVKLDVRPESKKRYAVICTFNNKDWVPQDFGRIKKGTAFFKNMGSGILYRPMYYDNGVLSPAGEPFILREDGTFKLSNSLNDKTRDMLLLRKFPKKNRDWIGGMVNGYFEGANKPDFSDPVKLFTVIEMPEKIESAVINNPLKFRYIRYKSPLTGTGNVAELWFYGGDNSTDTLQLNGKITGYPEVPYSIGTPYTNAFDGNLETFFDRYSGGTSWAGLDLGKPKRITKIKYCPRSDTNFILVGDTYELCYWENGEWVSMGEQVAKDQYLIYKNVPSGGLYILHDLTRGKEERIFTYEDSKQIWW